LGNFDDNSVKVSLNESGEHSGLGDGRGAGRGADRKLSSSGEKSLSSCIGTSRAILMSEMFARLLLALTSARGDGEREEDALDSSSSIMMFRGDDGQRLED